MLTATPEIKFLTRAVGMADTHLAWTADISAEQAAKDLDNALKSIAGKKTGATITDPPAAPKLMLFADNGPSGEVRKLLEERGIQFVIISLIDNRPEYGSYLTEVGDNLKKLALAVEQD